MDPPVAIMRFALARSAMFLFFFSISRPRTSVAGFAIERTRARDDGARRGGDGGGRRRAPVRLRRPAECAAAGRGRADELGLENDRSEVAHAIARRHRLTDVFHPSLAVNI
eukprot:31464-Pelagococcus_subviridis.AAC.4